MTTALLIALGLLNASALAVLAWALLRGAKLIAGALRPDSVEAPAHRLLAPGKPSAPLTLDALKSRDPEAWRRIQDEAATRPPQPI